MCIYLSCFLTDLDASDFFLGLFFFFSSRRRHTRLQGDWSSDVCSSDLADVKRRLGFSTRAVHGDPEARPDWAPVVAPLYQSATFTNPIGSSQEVIYARYGNNPNHVAIAKRLALLEGAEAALFVGSGMGAIALSRS